MSGQRIIGVIGVLVVALLSLALTLSAESPDVRLADAAMEANMEAVRSLLQQDVDVNGVQGDGMSALHWAAVKDDLKMARLLIEAGADVESKTRLGDLTPLFLACTHGRLPMISLLLSAGADPNAASTVNGQTSLMRAAASGGTKSVQLLAENGADVNARERAYGQTALMFAAAANRSEAIQVLVELRADLEVASDVEDLRTRPRYDETGAILPDPPPDPKADLRPVDFTKRPKATVTGGMTALLFAARDGQMDAVRALVEAGADVNRVSPGDFSSPIIIAAANANFDVAKYLLEHGANPNAANSDGLVPLTPRSPGHRRRLRPTRKSVTSS